MLILQLTVVLLLILLNGFFAMAEIALIAARRARLKALADTGNPGAAAALELKSDPSRLLGDGPDRDHGDRGIVRHLWPGDPGRAAAAVSSNDIRGSISRYAHAISMAIVVIGISYLSLIIGELVPKRVAMSHAESIAAALARIMRALSRIGAPIEWFLSASTDLVLRLLPLRSEATAPVTDEEISFMLREGTAAGYIPQAETEIVEMALRLGDRRASAVMTPRTRIEWLDLDDPEEENRARSATAPILVFLWCKAVRSRSSASSRPRICSPVALAGSRSTCGRRRGRRFICRTRCRCCASLTCSKARANRWR